MQLRFCCRWAEPSKTRCSNVIRYLVSQH